METNGDMAAAKAQRSMSSPVETSALDIPDNLTIPQFFSAYHASRLSFSNDSPCLVEEPTGRTLFFRGEPTSPLSSHSPQLTAAIHTASVSISVTCQRHSFEAEHRYVISLLPICIHTTDRTV